MTASSCAVKDCDRPLHPCGRGYPGSRYCTTHHVRVTKYGEPFADIPIDHYRGKTLAQQRAELSQGSGPSQEP